MIYSEEGVWPPDELDVARDEPVQLCHKLNDQGQYLGASPLHPVSTATCVRVREGTRTVSDGPYAETKEHLAEYFLIDVAYQTLKRLTSRWLCKTSKTIVRGKAKI